METFIVRPDNKEQLKALKVIMKALKIPFEQYKEYDHEFVKMVQQGDEDIKAGKGAIVDIDNLWK
jgi:hypothetical protein